MRHFFLVLLYSSFIWSNSVWGYSAVKSETTSNLDSVVLQLRKKIENEIDQSNQIDLHYSFIATLVAMNYVQTIASRPRYGTYVREANDYGYIPVITAEDVLLKKAGICGNQVDLFMRVMSKLGIKTREVQFYYEDFDNQRDSHITVEVQWDNSWHFFDVTWGLFFTDLKNSTRIPSYNEIHQEGIEQFKKWQNNSYGSLISLNYANVDPTIYLLLPDTKMDTVIDGTGVVRPYLREGYSFSFISVPKYFGYMQRRSGNYGAITHRYAIPSWAQHIKLTTSGYNCPKDGTVLVKTNGNTYHYSIKRNLRSALDISELGDILELEVQRNGAGSCFVVIDNATLS